MTKTGYMAVLAAVIGIHWYLLQRHVVPEPVIAKPQSKVYHITLSRVSVKKPPPPQIPPSPQITPVTPPSVTATPPKPKPLKRPKPRKVLPKPKLHPKKRQVVKKVVKKIQTPPDTPPQPTAAPAPSPVRQAAPQRQVETATIKARYIALIRQKIRRHLYYPRMARRMRIQGEVEVAFVVNAGGEVGAIRVIRAPKTILANAAVKTLQSIDLPPIPPALHRKRLELSIPIEFKLHKGAS